jgi:hypothetical protein
MAKIAAMAGPPDPTDVLIYQHVRVVIGIILGLSVTRLIAGVARFIQHPQRHELWWPHLGWVAWALLNVVTFWWWEFRLIHVDWSFAIYGFVLFYAAMYYLLASLLFPDDLGDYANFKAYFLSRRAWFFGLLALTELLDVVDTWIKGSEHLSALGPAYVIRIAGFLVLCAVAARTRNGRLHGLYVLLALAYELSFFSRYFGTVA